MSELIHYGVKRRSGRYPWGSGKDPQHSLDLLATNDELKFKGLSEKQRADHFGMSINELRSNITWANKERRGLLADKIQSSKNKGLSNSEIANNLKIPESTVRNYLNLSTKFSTENKQLDNITEDLKKNVEEKGYIDVGVGVNQMMGISKTKLMASLEKLKEEGYYTHEIYVKQLSTGDWTRVKVLTKDPSKENTSLNKEKIRLPNTFTDDGGITMQNIGKIHPISQKRLEVIWNEDGGSNKDGVMELRRGVKDLDLGDSHFAQVRIQVGKNNYLKGMAMYADDLPEGIDIRFNTNKNRSNNKMDALKKLKQNSDNPFGATIVRQKGALNIVNEEGDWYGWSSTLSSQFLSKQPLALVKDRLNSTFKSVKKEFDDINKLTNPTVKSFLMDKYGDDLTKKASSLKAQSFPKTKQHVILPFNSIKDTEVYAPNYKDGEMVILLRHPHGGIFELPNLKVNNSNKDAKKAIGNALDAIGINPKVASKLSGADFDGDTVLLIPNNKNNIAHAHSLKELKDFDPNMYRVGHSTISNSTKQTQMGIVSNLITDMTIKGAPFDDIAKAVKHSMVVIDSEKHNLDWKQSERDNNISALQKRYQSYVSKWDGKNHTRGASTIVSLADKDTDVPDDKRKGKLKKVPLMDTIPDARLLSSGTKVENEYAKYANNVKRLASDAKKIAINSKPIVRNQEATKLYSNEVLSLNRKLSEAKMNAPKERQAQILANVSYSKKIRETPELQGKDKKDERRRIADQTLAAARVKRDAKKSKIYITDKEWEAIQSGAISNSKLKDILLNGDMDRIRELATPKTINKMSAQRKQLAISLMNKGYSTSQVADSLGVSVSYLNKNV